MKRVLPRVLIVLTSLVCFAAQALTDSRTAIFATALGIALEAFLAGALLLKKRRSALRVAFAIVIAIAAYGAFTQGSVLVRTVYPVSAQALEEYKDATAASETDGAAVSAQAQAEYKDVTTVSETDGAAVASRDLSDLDSFNGRTGIWLGTLKGIKEDPSILLTGTSPLISGQLMDPYFPPQAPDNNIHNSYLSWLVSYGVPGTLLLIAFLVLLAAASIKLTFGAFVRAFVPRRAYDSGRTALRACRGHDGNVPVYRFQPQLALVTAYARRRVRLPPDQSAITRRRSIRRPLFQTMGGFF